jgi:ribosomal protein S21
MVETFLHKNEKIESALKRLKIKIFNEGIIETVYLKRFFETNQQKRKRKLKQLQKKSKYT